MITDLQPASLTILIYSFEMVAQYIPKFRQTANDRLDLFSMVVMIELKMIFFFFSETIVCGCINAFITLGLFFPIIFLFFIA